MAEITNISKKTIERSKIVASKIEDKELRKRAYALNIAANTTAEYLTENGMVADTKLSLFRIPAFAKSMELADVYVKGIRLDVRLTFDGKTFTVPKIHEKYDAKPAAYIVVQLSKDLTKAQILGFVPSNELQDIKSNSEYLCYETAVLQPVAELGIFISSVNQKQHIFSSAEHEKIKELYAAFIDDEISESEKIYFIKHVIGCPVCRETFCDINDFDVIVSQVKNYHELLNDSTLSILSGNKKEVNEAALAGLALVENAEEILEETTEEPSEEQIENPTEEPIEELIEEPVEDLLVETDEEPLKELIEEEIEEPFLQVPPVLPMGVPPVEETTALEEVTEEEAIEEKAEESEAPKEEIQEEEILKETTAEETLEELAKEDVLEEVAEESTQEAIEEPVASDDTVEGLELEDLEILDGPDTLEPLEELEEISEPHEPIELIEEEEEEKAEDLIEEIHEDVSEELKEEISSETIDETTEEIQEEPDSQQEEQEVDADIQDLLDDDLLALLSDDEDTEEQPAAAPEYEEPQIEITESQETMETTIYQYEEPSMVEEPQQFDDDMISLDDEEPEQQYQEPEQPNFEQEYKEEYAQEEQAPQEEDTIESLYSETNVPQSEGDDPAQFELAQEPVSATTVNATKKIIVGAAVFLLLAGGGAASWFFNHAKTQDNINPDMQNPDAELLNPQNNGTGNGEAPAVSQDLNKSMTNSFSDKPAAITITKLSWQVSEKLAQEASVKEYLQTAGKNIQMNLQNDLANSADINFNNSIKVSFEIAPDNTLKGMQVLESSGSDQIDDIVLRSIKNTLKYVSVPKLKDFKSDYFLTLIINF